MSLRYSSTAVMPDGMRRAADLALRKGATPAPEEKGDKHRKYRNTPVTVDGFRFDSKKEARHYETLKLLQEAGEVAWFIRQVPFHLPGNVRYVADFLVVRAVGMPVIHEVKSKATRTSIYVMKRKQVERLYSVEIIEI